MKTLIKLFQLVISLLALIFSLTLSVLHFQPTVWQFIMSVLINSLVGALVYLSYKELKNEE